jgi:hypothetical protein
LFNSAHTGFTQFLHLHVIPRVENRVNKAGALCLEKGRSNKKLSGEMK